MDSVYGYQPFLPFHTPPFVGDLILIFIYSMPLVFIWSFFIKTNSTNSDETKFMLLCLRIILFFTFSYFVIQNFDSSQKYSVHPLSTINRKQATSLWKFNVNSEGLDGKGMFREKMGGEPDPNRPADNEKSPTSLKENIQIIISFIIYANVFLLILYLYFMVDPWGCHKKT